MDSVLQSLEPSQAQDILAELIERFTPQPYDLPAPSDKALDLLHEFQARLGLDVNDFSEAAAAKILPVITDELTARLQFDKEAEFAAKQRLGNRGELPIAGYEISFADGFADSEKLGVTKDDAIKAIRHSDKSQHFSIDRETETGKRLSLFLKRLESRYRPGVLVSCMREGATLVVSKAYLIFLSDVPAIEQSSPPVEWLQKFVHRYGLHFFLGEKGPFLFVTYETIPILSANNSLMRLEKVPQQHTIESTFNFRISELGVAEVTIAYAIDSTEYLKDLRRHGIRPSALRQ